MRGHFVVLLRGPRCRDAPARRALADLKPTHAGAPAHHLDCFTVALILNSLTRMRIALFQPDIPQNTGTILRLCACLGIEAHIVEPAGFPVSDRVCLQHSGRSRPHGGTALGLAAARR